MSCTKKAGFQKRLGVALVNASLVLYADLMAKQVYSSWLIWNGSVRDDLDRQHAEQTVISHGLHAASGMT